MLQTILVQTFYLFNQYIEEHPGVKIVAMEEKVRTLYQSTQSIWGAVLDRGMAFIFKPTILWVDRSSKREAETTLPQLPLEKACSISKVPFDLFPL